MSSSKDRSTRSARMVLACAASDTSDAQMVGKKLLAGVMPVVLTAIRYTSFYASVVESTMAIHYGECGHRVSLKGVRQCRPCRTASLFHGCIDCGKKVHQARQRCEACYRTFCESKKPKCVDCGQPTKQYASEYFAERCWDCEVKRRRSTPERKCSVEGCGRKHTALGLCRSHYFIQHQQRQLGNHRGGALSRMLALWPCQLCGYSKMKSNIHRLVPGSQGGKYHAGNMVALCVRCHAEVHRGLTLPPQPPTEIEIRRAN